MSNQASLGDISGSETQSEESKEVRGEKIPTDWDKTTVGEVSEDMADGGTPDRKGENGFFGGKINWAVIQDIEFEIYDTEEKLTEDGLDNSSATLWPEGSVIVSTGASIGEVGIAKEPTATKQGITGIITKEDASPHFLARYLQHESDLLEARAQGSTIQEIRPYLLKKVEMPLPPEDEQRRIASVLYNVDQAIQKTEEIIKQTEWVKKGLIEELTMKGVNHENFKEIEVTPRFLYIEVPENWEKVSYDEISENITYGFTSPMPEAESGPWRITAKDIHNGKIHYEEASKTKQEAYDERLTSKSRPEKGTVLVTKDGTLGRVGIVDQEDICINQSVASIKPKTERVIPEYLALTLKSPLAKKLIEAHNPQTTIGHIKISELAEWEFALPPIEEQKEIVSIVNSVRDRLKNEKEQKEQFQRLKKGLMQDLLTGEVRTSEDVRVLDEVVEVEDDPVEDLRERTKDIRESDNSVQELKDEAREELESNAGDKD